MDFKKTFGWRSNLSNDDRGQVWTGLDFGGKVAGVEKHIFWSKIRSGFEEPGGYTSTKNSQGYP